MVLCIGVLQHTPSPEEAIASLARQLAPGGWLAIDHYTWTARSATKLVNFAVRPITRRLSPARGIRVTEALARVFLPLHRAVRGRRWAQYALSRVSPVVSYYHVHPDLPDDVQYQWALLDTHDTLTDFYKHRRNVRQIREHLERLGLVELDVRRHGTNVEARARRPEA